MRSLTSYRRKKRGDGDYTGRSIPHGYFRINMSETVKACPIQFHNPFTLGKGKSEEAEEEQSCY